MEIFLTICDYIKVAGSLVSIAVGIYFLVRTIKNRSLAKKPLKDAKKREKMMKEFAILSKELGIVPEKDAKKDEKVS